MLDNSAMQELVGTTVGDTIGLVIPSIDASLIPLMKLGKFRSVGIFGGRVAVGPQVMAVDEAVKAADVKLISMETSRDSKGGAGCGTLFYIGGRGVTDVRRAVEIALEQLPKQFGDVYVNDAGHLSFSYTARAGQCCADTLGAVEGKAFGIICCGPAAIGAVVSDLAVKSAAVTVTAYHHPLDNCFANEVVLCITGESAAIREALRTAIDAGKRLLGTFGETPRSLGTPWI